MNIEKVNINQIKPNGDNPRTITDDKRKKLIQSIKDFPEMLKIRPIVVDEENTILGGNMRYYACKDAGLEDIWIIRADELTEKQKKEFILKDNNGFGEWDLEKLGDWDKELLIGSGFEEWQMIGIFGENELESNFTSNLEGSNFNVEAVDVNDYIKQNVIFLNELMLEFEDDEVKEGIREIRIKGLEEAFTEDLKEVIRKYGKN